MNLLIYGSNGWIGQQFVSILESKKIDYVCGTSRVNNVGQLEKEIDQVCPTHIVSFIGRTHGKIRDQEYPTIDYLEQEGKLVENIRDNLFSPISLGLLCLEKNIHYAYLGTGCIFSYKDTDYTELEPYQFKEKDEPNFFGSSYSIVKGFTDRLMHQMEKKNGHSFLHC